jgi:hypothetical protein
VSACCTPTGCERSIVRILDATDAAIARWLRLQNKDLPLPWMADTRAYNPAFVVIDADEAHWLVETKSDDAAKNEDVQAKARATVQWTTHVSAATGAKWRYLFVTESHIAQGQGLMGGFEAARPAGVDASG